LLAAIGKVVDNWAKDSQTARFKISGPPEAETVLDTQTGLMWTRIDYWSLEKAFAANWNDAMNWGKKLNAAGYGGYSDWAVPTIRQYKTMNASKEDRDLYLQVFRKTDATNFWSSETPDQRLARYISFTDGATIPGAKTDPGWAKRLGLAAFPISVRLVRVAQPASTDRQTGPRNPPPLLEQRRNARKAVLNRAKD
jgi:hypothetical protein